MSGRKSLTVTRRTRGLDGEFGPATTHRSTGWVIAPRSTEDTDQHGRQGSTIVFVAFGPYDADVAAGDVVTFDGSPTRYGVIGEPLRWSQGRRANGTALHLGRGQG